MTYGIVSVLIHPISLTVENYAQEQYHLVILSPAYVSKAKRRELCLQTQMLRYYLRRTGFQALGSSRAELAATMNIVS